MVRYRVARKVEWIIQGRLAGVGLTMELATLEKTARHFVAKRAKPYAKASRAEWGCTFLTGLIADADVVRRKPGFSRLDPVTDWNPVQHAGMIGVGIDRLNRWCMIPGMSTARQSAHAVRDPARPGLYRIA